MLFGAWHYRLAYDLMQPAPPRDPVARCHRAGRGQRAALLVALGRAEHIVIDGDENYLPVLLIVWAPISAVFVMALLVAVAPGGTGWRCCWA